MAIVTSKFRSSAASSFTNSFGTDSIYLVLGRPQSWGNALSANFADQGSGTINDNNPPNPADNYLNEYNVWRDALAAVKLSTADVRVCIPRNNWVAGTRYDMYRHDISSAKATSTGKFNLSESNQIVYVPTTGRVYKCLYNGTSPALTTGTVSTVAPSTSNAAPETTADGYVWKYLYTLTAVDADFITANYIPVPTTQNVSNINGINVIVVDSGGAGYTAPPTVTIYGDGTGATATADVSTGSVTKINITTPGSGYTWAKVVISGGGASTDAQATPIIAPTGGHGSNLIAECNAHNVMIAGTVSGYLENDVPINQDFRSVALIKNPSVYIRPEVTSAGTVATAGTARISRTLVMTSSATVAPANDTILTNAAGAVGIFTFQSSGTVNLQYIQPMTVDSSTMSVDDLARTDLGTLKLKEYANGNVLTGTDYSQAISSTTTITPELQPYSGELLYLDYRQPVTRAAGQNEKINIVVNF